MKKWLVSFMSVAIVACCATGLMTSAAAPEYIAKEGKVSVDGVAKEKEWADAAELKIDQNNSNVVFGDKSTDQDASKLNVTYKFKYDKNYLYILEVRKDQEFYFNRSKTAPASIHVGDSTLLYMAVYHEGEAFDTIKKNICDLQYSPNSKEGNIEKPQPVAALRRTSFESASPGTSLVGHKIVSKFSETQDSITTEIALPWKFIDYAQPNLKEGLALKIAPVICKGTAQGINPNYKMYYNFSDTSYDDWTTVYLNAKPSTPITVDWSKTINEKTGPSSSTVIVTVIIILGVVLLGGAGFFLYKRFAPHYEYVYEDEEGSEEGSQEESEDDAESSDSNEEDQQ